MNPSLFFPPEAVAWLLKYGLFCTLTGFVLLGTALLLRPFFLWYSGKSEVLDRLRRLEETSRQSHLELEILNRTLSIPLKKASAKAPAPAPEAPLIVTQETKEGFLQALARSRKTE